MSRITRDIEEALALNRRNTSSRVAKAVRGFAMKVQRHPIPVVAHFRHSLVLTYALPQDVLAPLLPPGLVLDTWNGFGFVAIAMVQTEALRPAFLPRCAGQNFFLTGYRLFARRHVRGERWVRGLRILRSDTDRSLMVFAGNLLTHYNYRRAQIDCREDVSGLQVDVSTSDGHADLHVFADLQDKPALPPARSPFANWHQARLFAGPLPFTFDYEPETHSLVLIEGVRREWKPQPVSVRVERCSFFDRAPFNVTEPLLANAFHVANIDYRWNPGVVEALDGERRGPLNVVLA